MITYANHVKALWFEYIQHPALHAGIHKKEENWQEGYKRAGNTALHDDKISSNHFPYHLIHIHIHILSLSLNLSVSLSLCLCLSVSVSLCLTVSVSLSLSLSLSVSLCLSLSISLCPLHIWQSKPHFNIKTVRVCIYPQYNKLCGPETFFSLRPVTSDMLRFKWSDCNRNMIIKKKKNYI